MKSCFTFNPKHQLPGKKVWKGLIATNLRKLHPTKSARLLHLAAARISLGRRPRRHHHHASARSFHPVYVDELIFGDEQVVEGSTLMSPAGKEEKGKTPAVPLVTPSSGEVMMWDVDERAKRFISEFRKEMSLERKRSDEEFLEMLARGACM